MILNSPKLIEQEKAKLVTKEKALKESEAKKPSNKSNTVNGTDGTPIHVNTLQVTATLFTRLNMTNRGIKAEVQENISSIDMCCLFYLFTGG